LVNAVETGLGARLVWLKEPSHLALPRLLAQGRRFDLCFVDGSHLFGDIFIDAYFAHKLLDPGGLLVLDDTWLAATRTVRSILVSNFGFRDESVPAVPNFAVLRKTGEGRLDWKSFADAFAAFTVG
jgi:hypothetical protein